MATIGLDRLFYAPITEAESGIETYGKPLQLAKAISADLSVELAEATLYADDGAAEIVKEFKSGKLTLGVTVHELISSPISSWVYKTELASSELTSVLPFSQWALLPALLCNF